MLVTLRSSLHVTPRHEHGCAELAGHDGARRFPRGWSAVHWAFMFHTTSLRRCMMDDSALAAWDARESGRVTARFVRCRGAAVTAPSLALLFNAAVHTAFFLPPDVETAAVGTAHVITAVATSDARKASVAAVTSNGMPAADCARPHPDRCGGRRWIKNRSVKRSGCSTDAAATQRPWRRWGPPQAPLQAHSST